MYQQHFGLRKRPFSRKVVGTDVFVGPQTAAVMSVIKKALTTADAVITVAGPVGVGKTTVVRRALDTLGDNRIIITIGRLKLGYDEVIELLLAGLGAKQLPKSTIQRFALFRRLLCQYDQHGMRVFILVEDASCIGMDALAELESLTAEDAGASNGASLVLMGAEGLSELFRDPQLARLGQRIRLRQTMKPLAAAELKGYLNHCFRLSGGAFDSLFEAGAAESLHRYSKGIPRLCNIIAEQALTTAAGQGQDKVSLQLIDRTAAEEIGLPAAHRIEELDTALAQTEVENAAADSANGEDDLRDDDEKAQPVETIALAEATLTELADGFDATLMSDNGDDAEIPNLIQDTVPELAILAPEFDEGEMEYGDELVELHDAAPDELTGSLEMSDAEQIADWDREPTLAELRPDLDALERAIATARGERIEETDVPTLTPDAPARDVTPLALPEITLDREIQAKIDEAEEALRQTPTDGEDQVESSVPRQADDEHDQSLEATLGGEEKVEALPQPVTDGLAASEAAAADQLDAPSDPIPDRARIERLARQLSKTKTIEDMGESLAETLFGDEFSMIAAEVAASVANSMPANDEIESGVQPVEPEAAGESLEFGAAPAEASQPEEPAVASAESYTLDTSASQRLATVRALNNGGVPAGAPPVPEPTESIVLSAQPDTPARANGSEPESIEQQMNTSITQTLKALNARVMELEEETEEPRRGFFSRFRRS